MKAFPNEALEFRSDLGDRNGMDLRDYFAAKAMQGLCADRHHSDTQGYPPNIAAIAYEVADAMMKAREA